MQKSIETIPGMDEMRKVWQDEVFDEVREKSLNIKGLKLSRKERIGDLLTVIRFPSPKGSTGGNR